MKTARIFISAGAALLIFITIAQGQSQPLIPLIVKDTSSPYWEAVYAGGCQAGKDLKVTVPRLGAQSEMDIAGQISILENAVAQHPQAIVIAATSYAALGPPIDEAASKVIVVGIDSKADSKKLTSMLTTDNVEGGRMAARALAQAIKTRYGKAEGEVAIIANLAGASSLHDRMTGFKEALGKEFPALKIVATQIGDGQSTTSLNQTMDVLSAFPDLRGLFADAVFSGLGASQAVGEAKAQDRVQVVSFDSSDQLVKRLEQGVVKALVIQDAYRMGYDGVKTALAASRGQKVAAYVDTGAKLVTKENLKTDQIQQLLNPNLSCK
jgi:ribose transport system substrate-binding protein